MADHSPSAFPIPGVRDNDGSPLWPGMTLRQYYAGQALIGIIISAEVANAAPDVQKDSEKAFQYADAMIRVVEKG